MMYITLSAILMANLFPDPEIGCKFLGLFQFEACKIVLNLICGSLNSIGVCTEDARRTDTRVVIVIYLRYGYGDRLGVQNIFGGSNLVT